MWVNPIWPMHPLKGRTGGISGLGEPGVWVGWELGPQVAATNSMVRQTITPRSWCLLH